MNSKPNKTTTTPPKLRFPEFQNSGEWEENKLGDVVTFYNSKRIPLTASNRVNGRYAYYGASGIIDYVEDYIFDGEYILLGEDGANITDRNSRLVFLATGKFWVNNHAHVFQSNSSNYFLCELLELLNYTKYNTGSAQPKLNSDVVKKIKIHLPKLKEQQKIADCLSSLDALITTQTKKLTALQTHKKGLMQNLFPAEDKTTPKLRFPEFQNAGDWEEKKLSDLGNTFNGLTGKTKIDFGKGKPYIQYMQIFSNSKINTHNFGLVNIKDNESQNKVQYGDIFFTTSSETPDETGMSSVFMEKTNDNDVYLNSFCFGYRPNSLNELVPEFSQFFFRSDKIRMEIKKLAQGVTRFNMSKSKFIELKFNTPKEKEQQKIADCLSSLDNLITTQTQKLTALQQHKKGLMQNLFPNNEALE